MSKERFKSKMTGIYIISVFIVAMFFLGDSQDRPYGLNLDTLEIVALASVLFLFVCYLKWTTYLEIQDGRWLINSGFRNFRTDKIDIFDVKYIYRYPNFILKWYGSRMVFYIKTADGKLHRSSVREVNFSNDIMRAFLKRIKQLNPSIELDQEYELFLQEKLYLEDTSDNTVESVEARLKEKGERW
jgi:hypothetical protein